MIRRRRNMSAESRSSRVFALQKPHYKRKMKILFVCHGNICRSPMAQAIFTKMLEDEGLSEKFFVDSAATSREEIGNNVYPPARRTLEKHGIHGFSHNARQMTVNDYETFDVIKVMDRYNYANVLRMTGNDPKAKISMLLNHDVADPWYTGDFETTYNDIVQGCKELLNHEGFYKNLLKFDCKFNFYAYT